MKRIESDVATLPQQSSESRPRSTTTPRRPSLARPGPLRSVSVPVPSLGQAGEDKGQAVLGVGERVGLPARWWRARRGGKTPRVSAGQHR